MGSTPASPLEPCPTCGCRTLTRERVRSSRPVPAIEALACTTCGEWWFECGGARLTPETIVRLGLHR